MITRKTSLHDRRTVLRQAAVLGGSALLASVNRALAEPPPEKTTLRLLQVPGACTAPQEIAKELLELEGFSDVRYVKFGSDTQRWPPEVVLSGEVDINFSFPPHDISAIDANQPLVILAGAHSGCVEVIANDRVRSTPELKGKTVAVPALGSDEHVFISIFAKYVGVRPQDINWAIYPFTEQVQL